MALSLIKYQHTPKFLPANHILKSCSLLHFLATKRQKIDLRGIFCRRKFWFKQAYSKKRKDAERRSDEAAAAQLEKAYDGETFGSFKVLKDIKYADKLPVIPWGPSSYSDDLCATDYQQRIGHLIKFQHVYRIFEKLKATVEPPASSTFSEEGGEDEGRMLRMGKRLLRSLSLGYTGVLNVIEYAPGFVPVFLYINQELLVTASSALMLCILASYYR